VALMGKEMPASSIGGANGNGRRNGNNNNGNGKGNGKGKGKGKGGKGDKGGKDSKKCVGWVDNATLESTKISYRTRLDAAQKALDWYDRFLRIVDEESLKSLAAQASSSKVSWEVARAVQDLSGAMPRIKGYQKEASEFVTVLVSQGDQLTISRGFFSKSVPGVRAQYGDNLHQLFQANDAVYGNKKIDIVQFFAVDHNPSIRERITQRVLSAYAYAGQAVPTISLSSKPVRIVYNLHTDMFYIFYGLDGTSSSLPWVGYAIRITDDNLVDWSLPENIYFEPQFSMFSDVNNRNSALVDVPMQPQPSVVVTGGRKKPTGKARSRAR